MTTTPKRQLLEDRLGQPLGDYLQSLRDDDRSYRWIARKVSEQTGIEVSHQLIRTTLQESA